MPKQLRVKTTYPGIYYVDGISTANNKCEKIYYIRYRKNGKMVEEKAGRQFQEDMTPARAAHLRARRIHGDQPTNREKRDIKNAQKETSKNRPTFTNLWAEYKHQKPDLKGLIPDENRFNKYLLPAFGNKEPQDLIPLDVDRLRLKMIKKKSPQTVKLTLSLLRRIANFGVKKGLCAPYPSQLKCQKSITSKPKISPQIN